MNTHYHAKFVENRTARNYRGKLLVEKVYRVQVRLSGGVVFTHKAKISKFRATELIGKMKQAQVHERSFLEMRRNPHWEPADSSIFINTHHSGRALGGRYSYTVYASTRVELEEWVERLYGAWHPMGYGTIANPIAVFRDLGGRDVYQVTATRWGSCD